MRWKNRPEGSNWGDFGPDDQRGCLNYITPANVMKGIQEVREGLSFCLSLPLDYPGGNGVNVRRHPPKLRPTERDGDQYLNFPLGRLRPGCVDVLSDDIVEMSLQYSTQWDSLAHVGALFDANGDGLPERVYYNGYRPNEHVVGPVDYDVDELAKTDLGQGGASHAKKLDITQLAESCLQSRGVMVDGAPLWTRAEVGGLRRSDAHHRGRWHRDRAGRYRAVPYGIRRCAAGEAAPAGSPHPA